MQASPLFASEGNSEAASVEEDFVDLPTAEDDLDRAFAEEDL